MANAGPEEFAEFGATVLDTFQDLFEETGYLDHRTNDAHARELLGDLLVDLMHYAERRALDFGDILGEARGYFRAEQHPTDTYAIGSTVELEGPAAEEAVLLGRPTRGTITGFFVPDHGFTEYYVHFLGDKSAQRVISADLDPAPRFPSTLTTEGAITNPLKAEDALVEATTRIGLADVHGVSPAPDDLRDHRALLRAFASWTGLDRRSVTDLLLSRVAERLPAPGSGQQPTSTPDAPAPGRLAAQGFPVPLAEGLRASIGGPPKPRPDAHPKRQGPNR
ncbi:hypothetical protein [Actinomadura sp. WMMB 499]|uniref:hypothetical protein n=1 Tax=Actinomadura sp. WMMB 499 TaxID=1219491 RepID=UPI00124674EF|nr:hypothetical protein [Actinomadura sp. WMMB 499]QFG22852.1 hypothetical protein F7P10_18755 [Actinomadura sp. WMMB 499]